MPTAIEVSHALHHNYSSSPLNRQIIIANRPLSSNIVSFDQCQHHAPSKLRLLELQRPDFSLFLKILRCTHHCSLNAINQQNATLQQVLDPALNTSVPPERAPYDNMLHNIQLFLEYKAAQAIL